MSTRVPSSYDEITRRTVPDPDSSWRPTEHQERVAYHGFRALDAEEQALAARVYLALEDAGVDIACVHVDVERDRVILHGRAHDLVALRRIPEIVKHVTGVGEISDQLVIGGP
jgi:osmotically-inducible protein OsmY